MIAKITPREGFLPQSCELGGGNNTDTESYTALWTSHQRLPSLRNAKIKTKRKYSKIEGGEKGIFVLDMNRACLPQKICIMTKTVLGTFALRILLYGRAGDLWRDLW